MPGRAGCRPLRLEPFLAPAGLALVDRVRVEQRGVPSEIVRARRVPVALTLGGGYAADTSETVRLHIQTLSVFAGLPKS